MTKFVILIEDAADGSVDAQVCQFGPDSTAAGQLAQDVSDFIAAMLEAAEQARLMPASPEDPQAAH